MSKIGLLSSWQVPSDLFLSHWLDRRVVTPVLFLVRCPLDVCCVSVGRVVQSSEVFGNTFDASVVRRAASGLTQLGVYLCRVAPHTQSTVLHWHNSEDEWVYVLDAGAGGATLLILFPGADAPVEEPLKAGDFLDFAAGRRDAHACRAGETELVYLCGGTRNQVDVWMYPGEGKRYITDWTGKERSFFVEDTNMISRQEMRNAREPLRI